MTIMVVPPQRPVQINLEALTALEAELAETMNGMEGWPHMLGSMLNDAVLNVHARLACSKKPTKWTVICSGLTSSR